MNKTSFRYLPSVVTAGIYLLMLVQAANAQGTSAAEESVAARAVPSSLDQNVVGHTVGGDYRNEYLGIEIRHIPGWTSMSRGMMNVNEAVGRDALGMKAGNHSGNRVFGMRDEAGSSVIVTIVRIPSDAETDSASLKSHLAKMTKSQLPTAQVADEATLLDDSAHHFAALRVYYSAANKEIFQSLQMLPLDGYALSLTLTAPSAKQLQEIIQQVQSRLQWIPKQPAQ